MRRTTWVIILIAWLAWAGALRVARTSFERLPQLEDEFAYTYQAKIFAGGNIVIDTPQPRRAFWQPFLIDHDGQRFGKYPPGWPLLLALGYGLGFPSIINAWFALLTIALIYRLGREIYSEEAGIIAAIFLAASPIAILQNATYMAHPSALFFTLLALYGIWRLEKNSHTLRWGLVAGSALGMLMAIRPTNALTVGAPLVIYSAGRLLLTLRPKNRKKIPQAEWWLRPFILWIPILLGGGLAYGLMDAYTHWSKLYLLITILGMAISALVYTVLEDKTRVNPPLPQQFLPTLYPLGGVLVGAILLGSLYPAFNTVATGNPADNLYTYVWSYDTLGIGNDHGYPRRMTVDESVPTGEKIALWQYHNWDQAKQNLQEDMVCYSRDLFGWVKQPDNPPTVIRSNFSKDLCAVDRAGYSWLLLPLGFIFGWRRRWTYILAGCALSIIGITLFYWIGAATYSARYYYEATGIFALISAVGAAGIIQQVRRWHLDTVIYGLVGLLAIQTAFGYTPRRLQPIETQFTNNMRRQMANLETWQTHPNEPLLIIAYGDVHWRDINAFMAQTSPYLDSPVILARDPEQNTFLELEGMFPEYTVIYYRDGRFMPSPFE